MLKKKYDVFSSKNAMSIKDWPNNSKSLLAFSGLFPIEILNYASSSSSTVQHGRRLVAHKEIKFFS